MSKRGREGLYPTTSNWLVDMGKHAVGSLVLLSVETFAVAAKHIIHNLPSPADNRSHDEQA